MSQPLEWHTEQRRVNDLLPLEINPRKISEARRMKMIESLQRFNLVDIPVVDFDGTIISGHQRMRALQAIGRGEEMIDVRMPNRQLTEKERKEYNVLANTHFGEFDEELFDEFFSDVDLAGLGLEEEDLFGAAIDEPEPVKLEAKEDDYEVPDVIVTDIVAGDLFEIGPHRLLCGDSTSADDVAKLMGGEKAVLCHADPPYGMGKESDGVINDNLYGKNLDAFQLLWWATFRPHLTDNASIYIWGNAEDLWRLWFGAELSKREKMYVRNEIVWDKKSIPGMKSDLMTQYAMATERCLYIQLGEQFLGNLNSDQYFDGWDEIRVPLEKMAKDAGLTPSKLKELCGVGMYSHWFTKSQWCLIPRIYYNRLKKAFPASFNLGYEKLWETYNRLKEGYRNHINGILGGMRCYFDNGHDIMYDVWSFYRVTGEERLGHATPKPVPMTGRCIKSSSPEGEIIVEPFGGSGTTMVAAHQLNRRCFMAEIAPEYCQVIIDRMLKLDPTLQIKRNGQLYTPKKP